MGKKQILNLLYWVIFALIAFYFAYSKGWVLADFESIAPQQAKTMLEKDENVFLLDVRSEDEFKKESIDGATLIPLQILSKNLSALDGVKNKKIIVYCHSGNRSVAASRILVKNGFVPLNLKGGITQWKNDGFTVLY